MSAAVQISEPSVREFVGAAVRDVFKIMVGLEPILSAGAEADFGRGRLPVDSNLPQIVGTAGFAGECNGLIYLHLPLVFARVCTGHMLGLTDAELTTAGDEAVNDAIAELTNMTVGTFKNSLCDAGHSCTLTMPSILRGTNLTIEPSRTAVRHVYRFDCAGHRVTADVLMKPDE